MSKRRPAEYQFGHGHVYVIDGSQGLVKIGHSISPEQRIRSISTQGGLLARRSWVSDRVREVAKQELAAHAHFAHCRVIGEWFSCDFDEAVRFVGEIVFAAGIMRAEEIARQRKESEAFFASLQNGIPTDRGKHEAADALGRAGRLIEQSRGFGEAEHQTATIVMTDAEEWALGLGVDAKQAALLSFARMAGDERVHAFGQLKIMHLGMARGVVEQLCRMAGLECEPVWGALLAESIYCRDSKTWTLEELEDAWKGIAHRSSTPSK